MSEAIPITRDEGSFLKVANDYLRLGFSVIPIHPKGKKPLVAWEKYQQKPATAKVVESWGQKWPKANIGIVTGRVSGILVVDIDSTEGKGNYLARFGEIHNTISQKTGKEDGLHLFFKHPGFICSNRAALLHDIDIRCDGGYIVAPPSVHPSGNRYSWNIDPVEYGLTDLMDCPNDLLALLKDETVSHGTGLSKNYEHWVQDALEGVSKGQRNDMCAKLAGYFLRAHKGDTQEVEKILLDWNERNDPPMDWKEVSQTVRSIRGRQSVEELREESGVEIEYIKNLTYPDGEHIFVLGVRRQEIKIPMNILTSPTKCFDKIAEVTHFVGQVKNRSTWLSLINPILESAETIIMSEDETMHGKVREMINENMREDAQLKTINERPCIVGEDLYVKIGWIMLESSYDTVKFKHPREVGQILRDFGFFGEVKKTPKGSLRLWKIKLEQWKKR